MKKKNLLSNLIIINILLIMLFTLFSCSSSVDNSKYAYLFYEKGLTLMKIDVNSGKATPVCSDPLCDHNSPKCPFYRPIGVGNRFTITNDNKNIIYIAGSDNELYCLRKYSLTTGTVSELFSTKNVIKDMLLVKDTLFFTESLPEIKDGSITSVSTDIYSIDISDNDAEVEKLTKEPEKNTVIPDFIVQDNRMLWEIFETSEYFTTKLDYSDKKNMNRKDIQKEYKGDYNYKLTYEEVDNTFKTTITRINKKSLKEDSIISGLKYFRICDNYIFYTRKLEQPELIGKKAPSESMSSDEQATFQNDCSRKIYTCDLDGTNEKVVCELEPGYYVLFASSNVNYLNYYGDYHLIELVKYDFNTSGEITNITYDIPMVINVKTGEHHIITE
jgi:hypothetical protein